MTRIAALFDIHGNLPALEAVLADAQQTGVDLIVVGGDVVPGPMPMESLALLAGCGTPLRSVHGNGEQDVLAARRGEALTRVPEPFRDAIRWCASNLTDTQLQEIASWPRVIHIDDAGAGRILVCHATPRDDNEIITRDASDAALLSLFGEDRTALCGHTHMQFDRQVGRLRVVNAGSVGLPFGDPGAYWALVTGDEIMLRRTSYDLESAARLIRGTTYPGADAFASSCVEPPDARTMLAAFRGAQRS